MSSNLLKLVLLVGIALTGCSRKARTNRHLDRANQYFANQEYARAEIEYLNVLRLENGNPAALRQLGFALFEQGRYPHAFAFLQRAKAADPNNIEVRSKLAFGALLGRNLTHAREEALFVLSKQPTNEEALVMVADATDPDAIEQTRTLLEKYRAPLAGFHVALGLVELRAGQVAPAEANFMEAVRLNPKSATVRATLGNFYVRQGQSERAEPEFKAAAEVAPARSLLAMSYADFKIKQGRVEEGRKLLEVMAQKTPDFIPLTVRLAELAFAQKDFAACAAILEKLLSRGQANFDAQFLQGRLKLARGDSAGAATEFERLLAAFPKVPQLHYQLALSQFARGDTVLASASLNDALKLDPEYAEAILLRADLDIRAADYAPAITALTELSRRDPNLTQAHVLLANAHAARKDYAGALAEYQKLAATFPKNPQFPFLIGNLHLQQKDLNAARQAFEQTLSIQPDHYPALEGVINLEVALGQADGALKRLQGRISETPTNAPLQLLLARVHLAQGATNQAEAAMLKAVELAPEEPAGYLMLAGLYISTGQHQSALERLQAVLAKKPNDIAAHMLAAAIQDELKNFSASRDHYEKILTLHPKSAAALNNLAYIYGEHLNQNERAFELAKKARTLAPQDPAVAHTVGRLAYQNGDHQWALGLLQESARKFPDHPEVALDLARAQLGNGQLREAEASLAKAVTASDGKIASSAKVLAGWVSLCLNPERAGASAAEIQRALKDDPEHLPARYLKGWLLKGQGDFKGAQATFESILGGFPLFAPANRELAYLYSEHLGDYQKALDHALKARQAMPRDAGVVRTLGIVSYKRNDFRRAGDLLKEGLRQRPEDAEIQFYLGMTHLKLGENTQGREALGKVLTLDPNGKFAAAAKQALEGLE